MMPELSTEKGRNCRNKIEKGRKFLNLKIRRTRMKKVHHFQTARFDTLSERRWQQLNPMFSRQLKIEKLLTHNFNNEHFFP